MTTNYINKNSSLKNLHKNKITTRRKILLILIKQNDYFVSLFVLQKSIENRINFSPFKAVVVWDSNGVILISY